MLAGLQAGDVVYQIDDIQLRSAKHGLDVMSQKQRQEEYLRLYGVSR